MRLLRFKTGYLSLALSILLTVAVRTAAADTSHSAVEDLVRLDVISTRNFIYSNCDRWKSLELAGVKAADLRAKMDEVGVTDRLRLEDSVTLGDGIERSGRFRRSIPDITFGRKFWREARTDSIRKIGIVLHEFLGLMGFEDTDKYPISSAVMNELRSFALNGSLSPHLLDSESKSESRSDGRCPSFSGVWLYDTATRLGTVIRQNGCEGLSRRLSIVKNKNDFQFAPAQDTANEIRIGDQNERLENSMFNDLPIDFPVIYSARFENQKLIEEQTRPRAKNGCTRRTVTLELTSQDSFVEERITHCAEGAKKERYEYTRAR